MNEPDSTSLADSDDPADRPRPRSLWERIARLPREFFVVLVRGYQAIVGPHLPPSCRFTPTCSEYAVEAFRRYGALKGLVLTTWRLLRCHPLGGEGVDPPRWFGEDPPDPSR